MQKCSIAGCSRPAGLGDVCAPHFARRERLAANRSVRARRGACAIPECPETSFAEELCEQHLLRRRLRQRTWSRPLRSATGGGAAFCAVPGCGRTPYRLELCRHHFARWRSGASDWATVAVATRSGRCQINDCGRAVLGDGLCSFHHRRRATGVADWDAVPDCDVEWCDKRLFARGLCRNHYERFRSGRADWDKATAPATRPGASCAP